MIAHITLEEVQFTEPLQVWVTLLGPEIVFPEGIWGQSYYLDLLEGVTPVLMSLADRPLLGAGYKQVQLCCTRYVQ